MIYAISYADSIYENPQKLNLYSALQNGVNKTIAYTPSDLDKDFVLKNAEILNCKRGAGYWLWKPYVISKTLNEINDGDYLFYADAGSVYVRNISSLIDLMELRGDSIVVFDQAYIEKDWTKRDTFILLNCDNKNYSDTSQRMATFFVAKKTERTMQFVEEWLHLCEDARVLTDKINTLGKENYSGFIDHRHDQSVLSLLSKRNNISAYADPSINIQDWLGQKIEIGENKYWYSHKMPYISNLSQLVDANRLFYDRYWNDSEPLYLYGAGAVGKSFAEKARLINKKITGFVVTKKENITEKTINDIPVYSIDSMPCEIDDCKILVTLNNGRDEVISLLNTIYAKYEILDDFSRNNLIPYILQVCNKKTGE